MGTRRQHYVTFYSPGTFLAEETTEEIDSWDIKKAVEFSKSVVERYEARPYGFRFSTVIVSDPVPDGEGGTLEVNPKLIKESGDFFLTGKILTYDDVKARNDPKDRILISNMESNGWYVAVENVNSYRLTRPFLEEDSIVDWDGNIVRKGSDADLVECRRKHNDKNQHYN